MALDLLGATAPGIDVVLLDLVMPELDGFESLAAIKPTRPSRIPVIVVSGARRPRRHRPLRRDGRRRLPAPADQADAPPGPRRDVARRQAPARRQRPAARDRRPPAPGAVPVPVAPGRRARVDARGRAAARRPPAGRDRRVLRPARVHGLRRDRRARGAARRASASTTPTMGRRSIEFDGTLEHFAGDGIHIFFNDPVLQPRPPAARPCAWPWRMRDDVAALRGGWAQARLRPRVRGRHRGRATRPPGGSASRAATTTRRSATP